MASHLSRTLAAVLLAGLGLQSGCAYSEGGPGASWDRYTYVSRPHSPKTVTIVDTRTEEVVFTMDIPVGQQLVFDIDDRPSRRGEYFSGTMSWALMPEGQGYGTLRNRVDVPPANSRRIDLDIRPGPEMATVPSGG
jgi:hypothetical protein